MNQVVKIISKVNNQTIVVIEDGEKRVAIRPICEALGIDPKTQYEKIKSHPILNSTVVIIPSVAGDGKDREMLTIPYKYVFGWLFSIDPRKVKPEAAEAVQKYQMECYDVLYRHFVEMEEFLRYKEEQTNILLQEQKEAKYNYSTAKNILNDVTNRPYAVNDRTFDDWKFEKRQMVIPFDSEPAKMEE